MCGGFQSLKETQVCILDRTRDRRVKNGLGWGREVQERKHSGSSGHLQSPQAREDGGQTAVVTLEMLRSLQSPDPFWRDEVCVGCIWSRNTCPSATRPVK